MTQEEHARLAPSHANTWVNCAGAPNLEAKLPPPPDGGETEHSRRGTAAHEGLELCLTKDGYTPSFLTGKTMSNGYTLNAEDTQAIKVCVDYVKGLQEDALKHRLPSQLFVEEKLNIGQYLGRSDIFGTADIQFLAGNTLEVVDYKHGWTHVEAEENLQMILYAIGAMAKAHDPTTKRVALRKVRLTVVQPRGEDSQHPIRTWEVEPDDLFPWAEKIRAAAIATDNPEAELTPGDKQCKWCRVARESTCPARNAAIQDALSTALEIPGAPAVQAEPAPAIPSWLEGAQETPEPREAAPAPVPADPPAPVDSGSVWTAIGDAMGKEPELLPLSARVAIMEQEDMIRAFLSANAESVKREAMRGAKVPGWKLIRKLSNRKWGVSVEEVAKKLKNLKTKGEDGKPQKALALDEYMPRSLISAPQALKMVKPLVTDRVYKTVEQLVTRDETGPFLVPEATQGTPWTPPADQMFQKQTPEPETPTEQKPAVPSYLL